MVKIKILLLTKALIYTLLGLWILFANGLPPLETTSLLAIFPLIFPILVAAISLFLLPLIHQAFYFCVLIAFDSLVIVNSFQPFWKDNKAPLIIFILLGMCALIAMLGSWWMFRQKTD